MYSYSVHSQVYTLQTREFAVATRGDSECVLLIASRESVVFQVAIQKLKDQDI
jgi:hypothetical protein